VNAVCDVMLDTLRWSGGNTSLDAIAAGLPIVTLPGKFMRGRQSMAMLRLVGCPDLVAADATDYVSKASLLLQDAGCRQDARARLQGSAPVLYEQRNAVESLQTTLLAGWRALEQSEGR